MQYINSFFSIIGVLALVSVCGGQFQPGGDFAAEAEKTCKTATTSSDCTAAGTTAAPCYWVSGACTNVKPTPTTTTTGGDGQACNEQIVSRVFQLNLGASKGQAGERLNQYLYSGTDPDYQSAEVTDVYEDGANYWQKFFSCNSGDLKPWLGFYTSDIKDNPIYACNADATDCDTAITKDIEISMGCICLSGNPIAKGKPCRIGNNTCSDSTTCKSNGASTSGTGGVILGTCQ